MTSRILRLLPEAWSTWVTFVSKTRSVFLDIAEELSSSHRIQILQALVFCPPFYNLIRLLGQSLQHDLSGANKLLEATIWLVNEYKVIHQPNSATPREWSDPFLPEQIYEALKHNKRFETFQQGSQEDAQEFLGFFLDALHEELFSAVEKSDGRGQKTEQFAQEAGGDGWEEVGQKGRTATTRKVRQFSLYAPSQGQSN